jgi:serine/threonine-protein kinase/endoribonuclease IRE1
MPPDRPPGSPVSIRRLRDVLLYATLLVPFAAALQQQPHDAYPPSRPADLDAAAAATVQSAYDQAADSLNTQMSGQRGYRDTYPHKARTSSSNNQRALATLSPVESDSAVRAPPAHRSPASSVGLTSRLPARSLQDWQVEDIILLATVDGSIHARDRTNFAPRWQLESDQPMVETLYHRMANKSVDKDGSDLEDPLWIVEPSQDGSLYMYAPASGVKGMQRLGFTVKELADMSPYATEGLPAVAYTADKKTTLYTIDAATGNIIKMFSSGGSLTNNDRSCRRVNPLETVDEEECEKIGTLTLGRTEYTIGVQDRNTGDQITTLRYFEWALNNRDQDLLRTYTNTLDNKYVYTRHDGTVFRPARKNENRPASLHHKFSTPVARVFDVIRPTEELGDDISLVVLPQPVPPRISEYIEDESPPSVFVNCTTAGSWYALSDQNYPEITYEAPFAQCYETKLPGLPLAKREIKKFIGVHPLHGMDESPSTPLIAGSHHLGLDAPPRQTITADLASPQKIGSAAPNASSVLALIMVSLFVGFLSLGWYGHRKGYLTIKIPSQPQTTTQPETVAVTPSVEVADAFEKTMVRDAEPAEETIFAHTRGRSSTVTPPAEGDEDDEFEKVDSKSGTPTAEGADSLETPKKKKATRGRRGGKKQKEKDAAAAEAKAKKIGVQIAEPAEIISVAASESPQVTGPLQINSLIIHTDKVIGQGSCGTSVFEGSFEGRAVAVKRMLSQYYELASQEVSFLQQSDDHENVIRYYCQQKDDHFLYIAVELCQASLFEVWQSDRTRYDDRQQQLSALKLEIQKDVPRNLYQLAKGLHHLHKLRIIHRDIKPQNILVAFPKRYVDTGPRMVISDFGLGKNLPENVSTLIDPTGNAGTSGWKAPELISQPRENEGRHSQGNSLNGSESATGGTISGVKRAADIFSLGCLFFWLLTDGIHPYEDDNGWTQLRELNIKRDKKQLDVLERWSDAYEPMQLITSMLAHQPEHRPTALQVLNHPFFWSPEKRLAFLCDVSDHFEREPRGTYEDYYAGDSQHLTWLESYANVVIGPQHNFLVRLDRAFVDTLGKQRKYSGDRLLDLLRALRNKKNHYEDMSDEVKRRVGPLAGGYLNYWTARFPRLLMACYDAIHDCGVEGNDRFKGYFEDSAKA